MCSAVDYDYTTSKNSQPVFTTIGIWRKSGGFHQKHQKPWFRRWNRHESLPLWTRYPYININERLYRNYDFLTAGSEPLIYRLTAVLIHIGESNTAGHFIVDIKRSDGCWYRFNDGIVEMIERHQVGNEDSKQSKKRKHGYCSRSAYCLFYEKPIESEFACLICFS